ncbi:phage major capsid protein [Limobrevibacterium gyesilva]|uniref:HK97 family phage prohead protease n=1 Tax=Limobrevibacterium gyesilva TaxID=2991712 RepID=A0AA41YS64_9PROT|nr:HK97 family phage prohead protease [Limobrevibacterium gyesilva]MCW3477358.1 HK97 family phage prohead protease [Limobrevibacterium gyesilva]
MPNDLITRPAGAQGIRASFAPETWNPETRTVDVVWSTGAAVQRRDYWTGKSWTEKLDVSAAAVDLGRLNAGAPLLNTHSSWDLSDIVGVVVDGSATVSGGVGRAQVRFSERDEVAGIVADVAAGIIRNISVGYTVQKWTIAEATADSPEIRTASAWTPYEISLVPIPADAGAQVRAQPQPGAVPPPPTPQAARAASQEPTMTPEEITAATEAARAEARAAERARHADIAIIARQADLDQDWVQTQIAGDATVDQIRAVALERVASRATSRIPAEAADARRDERETIITRMADALTAARTNTAPPDHAREFMGLGMHGVIREIALRHGVKGVHRMTGSQLADLALSRRDGAGLTSSDFAAILTNSTNKYLRSVYGGFPQTWKGWTTEYDVADFKTITSAGMGNFPEPIPFAEGAAVPGGVLSDEGETFAVAERGRVVSLSRVAIVNDDMRAIDRAVQSAALAGYTALRRVVFGILTTNAAMQDGIALFHATHGNLGTAGTLTATTYSELLQLLMQMNDVSGQPMPPPTSVALLVPPSKQRTALEITSALIVPTAIGATLPTEYKQMTEVVMEPFLRTGNDPYFLMRKDVPVIDIAYLQGDGRVPVLTSESEIEFTGMTWRVTFNFGAKAVTWRSGASNVGG